MQLAQQLYEAGHITYMRTDGVALSPAAVDALRAAAAAEHGAHSVPPEPRVFKARSKNAQARRGASPHACSCASCAASLAGHSVWPEKRPRLFTPARSCLPPVVAQEAHEAIRPTEPAVTAEQLTAQGVEGPAAKLYGWVQAPRRCLAGAELLARFPACLLPPPVLQHHSPCALCGLGPVPPAG
jgi:DNA topoisomerase-1